MAAVESSNVFAISGIKQRARKTISTKDNIKLEHLKKKSFSELDRLYRQLAPPHSLQALNGTQPGQLLAIAGIHRTPLGNLLNVLGQTPLFPWTGKNFSSRSLIKGSGINRVNLTVAQQEWFAFSSSFKPSLIDHRPCLQLKYKLQGNPWFIRPLVDELRQVEPGLYLGATMLKTNRGKITLLFFAIGE